MSARKGVLPGCFYDSESLDCRACELANTCAPETTHAPHRFNKPPLQLMPAWAGAFSTRPLSYSEQVESLCAICGIESHPELSDRLSGALVTGIDKEQAANWTPEAMGRRRGKDWNRSERYCGYYCRFFLTLGIGRHACMSSRVGGSAYGRRVSSSSRCLIGRQS